MREQISINPLFKKQEFPNFKCGACGEQIFKICKDAIIIDSLGGPVFRSMFMEDRIALICTNSHLTIVESEVATEAYQLQQMRGPGIEITWKDELSGISDDVLQKIQGFKKPGGFGAL